MFNAEGGDAAAAGKGCRLDVVLRWRSNTIFTQRAAASRRGMYGHCRARQRWLGSPDETWSASVPA